MNKRLFLKTSVAVFAALFAFALNAEIKMNKLFSDNMVLQNGKQVKVWGQSLPNAKVSVKFAGQNVSTKADKNGEWSLYLKPLKINAKPQTMQVFENGKEGKAIDGVLVGEVWFISGQSNMQFGLSAADNYKEVNARANYPQIRFFMHPAGRVATKPLKDFVNPERSNWEVVCPDRIGGKSAVGFFFAEKLTKELKGVPVGLIQSALGGSAMITWIAREDLNNVKSHAKDLEKFDKENKNYNYKEAQEKFKKDIAAYNAEKAEAKKAGKHFDKYPPREPHPLATGRVTRMPGYLYNANVAPVTDYALRGFLWYQGEDDGYGPNVFEEKLTAIINGWRKYWGDENLPFVFMQLPSWYAHNDRMKCPPWEGVRWAQYNTAKHVKNTYMVVTIDLGEKFDIHPKNKIDVGYRAANIALKEVYGKKNLVVYGPAFKSFEYGGDRVAIKFDSFGKKMVLKGEPRGFEVFNGKKWVKAGDVSFDQKTNTVTVKGKDGDDVEGVRYLWTSWAAPDACLFNEDGLPVMSFTNKDGE